MKIKNLKKVHQNLLYIHFASIIITLIVSIALFYIFKNKTTSENTYISSDMINFNKGWYDKDKNEIVLNPLKKNPDFKQHKPTTYYHKITKDVNIGDTLCFRGLSTDITIYIDDKPIVSTPYTPHILSCNSPGYVWYFYTFTKKDIGKTLKMTTIPFYDDNSCYIDNMYVGNSLTYVKQYVQDNILPMVIAILILFLGIIYIILDIYISIKQKIQKHPLLYIGLFSIVLALWSLLASHIFDLLLGASQPVQFLACTLLYLIPVPALLFVKANFKIYNKKLISIVLFLSIALYALAWLLQLTNLQDFHDSLFLSHICIVINCLAIVYTFATTHKELRKQKNKEDSSNDSKKAMKSNIIIFCILIPFFVADIIVYYTTMNSNIGMFTRIAALFFILYLGIIAFQNLYSIDKEATHNKFVHKLAYTDGLTGIGNRTAFHEKITYIENHLSNYKTVGVITFDINNLKKTNDTYGHSLGDDLIISCANIIKQSFGEFSSIYRIGGDEFIAIIEKNNAEAVYKICSLQLNVNIQNFNNFYNKPYNLAIAQGSAFYKENRNLSIQDILQESDKEMYKNKTALKEKDKI